MPNVSIIYHHFPHYRAPVMRALAQSQRHQYRFWGSHDDVSGIAAFRGDDTVRIEPLRFRIDGRWWKLADYWPAVSARDTDALIVLGNPNMLATWWIAIAGRLLGKRVLFWAHGWLKPENRVKRLMRNLYFRLANRVLVYGERAERLAVNAGFPSATIDVIYNSLDYPMAQRALADIVAQGRDGGIAPQSLFPHPERPLLICTARITKLCRFDLLVDAAAKLAANGMPVNILLVGEGPERPALEQQALQHGIDLHFYGACYDEAILARLLYFADLTVSPGKIGLTLIHSLTYGTPAITHDNLDEQMPEVEAILPGLTGLLFVQNDSADLARTIETWLATPRDREAVRQACRDVVAAKWNPVVQCHLIDDAVDRAMGIAT